MLDPDSSAVERAPFHVSPARLLWRAWFPPVGDLLSAHECTRAHTVALTHGVVGVGGGVDLGDLCGSSSIRLVSLVVVDDDSADFMCRRGMVSSTSLLPEPKMKPEDWCGFKRRWQDS